MRILFLIAVVASIFSQLPFLLGTNTAELLKLSWLLPFAGCVFKSPKALLSSLKGFYSFFIIAFSVYCLFCEGISGHNYFGGDFRNILISFGVFAVSYAAWQAVGSQKFLNSIVILSLACTAILGAVIYFDFLAHISLSDIRYAYSSKNSAGQILLNAGILFLCARKSRFNEIFGVIILSAFIVEIFLLKSRATMVSLFCVILYLAFAYKNKTVRNYLRGVIVLMLLYFIYDSSFFEDIYKHFILANRTRTDLNTISSGRVEIIRDCIDKFKESPWIGVGNLYVDCFPVAVLSQYGILGCSIVFLFLIKLVSKAYKMLKYGGQLSLVAFLLLISILINALFEAYPPFGPGMKCFMVWMIVGFSLSTVDRQAIELKFTKVDN